MSVRQRILLAIAGVLLLALLLLATQLMPSPKGMGTHQQLGLSECRVVVHFGVRCPACGMTTAWSHFVRGQWVQAAVANLVGFLLALLATPLAVWMLASGIRGQWCYLRPQAELVIAAVALLVGVGIVDWLMRLFRDWP